MMRGADKMTKEIIITVEGGLIQHIEGIDKDTKIIVKDYDTEGDSPETDDRIKTDSEGNDYWLTVWEFEDAPTRKEQEEGGSSPVLPSSSSLIECLSCGEMVNPNSEDVTGTSCNKCGGSIK
jgi:hypothetical protein